jgi:hypothetical protein
MTTSRWNLVSLHLWILRLLPISATRIAAVAPAVRQVLVRRVVIRPQLHVENVYPGTVQLLMEVVLIVLAAIHGPLL